MNDVLLGVGLGVIGVLAIVIGVVHAALDTVPEYERLVVFRRGTPIGCRGPGLALHIPLLDSIQRVDLRIQAAEVAAARGLTCDLVDARACGLILYWRSNCWTCISCITTTSAWR
ncbi:MAG: hypothetical protein JO352_01180 [Chloroflexi bacterium]|nr:hypothetical protein [Chloroflexota bacterium]MBV9597810.1 hypothetical protein [Chloroflexota bacterium]